MAQAVRAGSVYFAIVFAAGFLLGTLRVFVLVPRLGETAAVLVELPVMLALCWFASRRIVAAFDVGPRASARLAMGGLAFALLMSLEVGLSLLVFRQSLTEFLAHYAAPAGLAGLAAQALFGLIPLLQRGRDAR